MRVFDQRMNDGSRHFASLPEDYDPHTPQWDRIREHVAKLEGATLTSFVTDRVTEAWIDFTFHEHAFSMNNQQAQWWFFVEDPTCPDTLLERVLDHFAGLLGGGAR